MTYFDDSTNYLHGDLSELRTLTNLVSLQLFENEISGKIPPDFGEFKDLVKDSCEFNLEGYKRDWRPPLILISSKPTRPPLILISFLEFLPPVTHFPVMIPPPRQNSSEYFPLHTGAASVISPSSFSSYIILHENKAEVTVSNISLNQLDSLLSYGPTYQQRRKLVGEGNDHKRNYFTKRLAWQFPPKAFA